MPLGPDFRRFVYTVARLGGQPSRRPEDVAEPVAPACGMPYVAGDRHVLERLQFPDVEGVQLFGQTVMRPGRLRLEAAEEPVEQNEDATVVAVEVLLIHAVVHPVV